MQFMNDYDLDCARQRFGRGQTPNRLALVMVVDNLREWADSHSDGWAYWPKPARAADKAMTLINSRTSRENDEQERHDITEAEMLAAVRPIKAFLTKSAKEQHGLHPHRALVTPDEREVILRAVTV